MSFANGRVVRVVLKATYADAEHVNVLHYDLVDDTTSGGANSPQALADFFRDNVLGRYTQLFASYWQIQPVVVQEERDPLDPFAPRSEWSSGTPLAGTKLAAGEGLPFAMCVVVRLQSDTIGRRYNGRMFLGGSVGEGDQSAGIWNAAHLAVITELVSNIPQQPDISEGPSLSAAHWSIYSRTARAQNSTHYLAHNITPIIRDRVHWLRSRDD